MIILSGLNLPPLHLVLLEAAQNFGALATGRTYPQYSAIEVSHMGPQGPLAELESLGRSGPLTHYLFCDLRLPQRITGIELLFRHYNTSPEVRRQVSHHSRACSKVSEQSGFYGEPMKITPDLNC